MGDYNTVLRPTFILARTVKLNDRNGERVTQRLNNATVLYSHVNLWWNNNLNETNKNNKLREIITHNIFMYVQIVFHGDILGNYF